MYTEPRTQALLNTMAEPGAILHLPAREGEEAAIEGSCCWLLAVDTLATPSQPFHLKIRDEYKFMFTQKKMRNKSM